MKTDQLGEFSFFATSKGAIVLWERKLIENHFILQLCNPGDFVTSLYFDSETDCLIGGTHFGDLHIMKLYRKEK